jgi:hypothetical protein
MPRFFFDLKFDGERATSDDDGLVLPDLESAQKEAAGALTELSKDAVLSGRPIKPATVIVRDEAGPLLQATLNFEMKRLN